VKKILLILLLTILPIQYSWSVAAVYCQHESVKVAHFGHHGHVHESLSDEGADKSKPSKAHADCEVCHHAVQASVPAADGPVPAAGARIYASPQPTRYLSHISEGPPRPNWPLVA
jgi:cytochrome c553